MFDSSTTTLREPVQPHPILIASEEIVAWKVQSMIPFFSVTVHVVPELTNFTSHSPATAPGVMSTFAVSLAGTTPEHL